MFLAIFGMGAENRCGIREFRLRAEAGFVFSRSRDARIARESSGMPALFQFLRDWMILPGQTDTNVSFVV